MRDIEKLKKQLNEDSSFREKFKDVKDADEALLLAERLGYKIKKEDLENDEELSEDLLEAVSGGAKRSTEVRMVNVVRGKGSKLHYLGRTYDESKS